MDPHSVPRRRRDSSCFPSQTPQTNDIDDDVFQVSASGRVRNEGKSIWQQYLIMANFKAPDAGIPRLLRRLWGHAALLRLHRTTAREVPGPPASPPPTL